MWKLRTAMLLVTIYITYSLFIYSVATEPTVPSIKMLPIVEKGKALYHSNNCAACHQVFGLGGFLGPDLTNITSRNTDGFYLRAILNAGSKNMPAYNFNTEQKDAIISYLNYLNQFSAYGLQ